MYRARQQRDGLPNQAVGEVDQRALRDGIPVVTVGGAVDVVFFQAGGAEEGEHRDLKAQGPGRNCGGDAAGAAGVCPPVSGVCTGTTDPSLRGSGFELQVWRVSMTLWSVWVEGVSER